MKTTTKKLWVIAVTTNDFLQEKKSIIDIARQINKTVSPDAQLVNIYIQQLDELLKKGWDYAFYREDEINEPFLPDRYVQQRNQVIEDLQIKLGRCATKYRSAIPNSPSDKQALTDYYETFDELVRINGGIIGLDPDSELPDRLMPKAYVDFWLNG